MELASATIIVLVEGALVMGAKYCLSDDEDAVDVPSDALTLPIRNYTLII